MRKVEGRGGRAGRGATGPAPGGGRARRRTLLRALTGLAGAAGAACSAPGLGPAAPPPAALPAATVEVWYNAWGGRTVPVMEGQVTPALRARFPQITLNLVQNSSIQALLVAAAGGTAPSLVYLGAAQVVTAVRAGLALALDDRVKLWGRSPERRLLPGGAQPAPLEGPAVGAAGHRLRQHLLLAQGPPGAGGRAGSSPPRSSSRWTPAAG